MVFSTASKQFQIEVEGSAEAYYGIGNRIHRHRSQKMINRDLTGYIVHHLLTPINATPDATTACRFTLLFTLLLFLCRTCEPTNFIPISVVTAHNLFEIITFICILCTKLSSLSAL